MDDVTENLAKFSGAFKKKAQFNKKKQQYKKLGESVKAVLERFMTQKIGLNFLTICELFFDKTLGLISWFNPNLKT